MSLVRAKYESTEATVNDLIIDFGWAVVVEVMVVTFLMKWHDYGTFPGRWKSTR